MVNTYPFDASEFMHTPEQQTILLNEAFASGDVAYIAEALGVVARARGMTAIAREAGVNREALYRALSAEGDPRLSTLVGVLRGLRVQLAVTAAPAPAVTTASAP